MDKEARKIAMERLDAFVGTWGLAAEFPGAPLERGGTTTFEWALGGQFLIQRSEIPHPAAPDGLSIVGPAEDGAGYLQHYFDSRGVVRLYAMTFEDGGWTLLRTEPDFTPLDFSQRYVGTFSEDGRTIDGRWETLGDDAAWQLDFRLIYEKVG